MELPYALLQDRAELPVAGMKILPARGQMRVPVRLFASPRLDPSADELIELEWLASLEGVAQVVALPDLHVKPQLESPSSTAVALRDRVALGLSSPSSGCGMALALTSLGEDDLSAPRLDALFASLARRLPLRRTGEPLMKDIRPALLQGASASLEHFNLDSAALQAIERGGDALCDHPQAGAGEVLGAIPAGLLPLASQEFGTVGRGNHFFELQVIEDILDPQIATAWGLRRGQIAAMYHADSGRLGALLGRLYAHRRKNNPRGRLLELRVKTAFHLAKSRSPADALRRAGYYFTPRRLTSLPADSRYARQALLAQAAASNYAYANRIAILAALRDALREVWGREWETPALLYDLSHNSIRSEEVEGERLWVHRHNASRALPAGHAGLARGPYAKTGQPLLLPGLHRTHSYLCAALPGAAASLFSVDHGAGRSAARLGRPLPASPHAITRVYGYGQASVREDSHLSDDGIDEVAAVLSAAGLARPVARLRPLAVLKDVAA